MKKIIGKIFKALGILLLALIVFVIGWRLLYGRNLFHIPHDTEYVPPPSRTVRSATRRSPSITHLRSTRR